MFVSFFSFFHKLNDNFQSQRLDCFYFYLLYICYKIQGFCIPDMNTCTCPLLHPLYHIPIITPLYHTLFGTPQYFSCVLPRDFSAWVQTTNVNNDKKNAARVRNGRKNIGIISEKNWRIRYTNRSRKFNRRVCEEHA